MTRIFRYKTLLILVAVITMFASASAYAEDGGSQGGVGAWFKGLFGGPKQVQRIENRVENRIEDRVETRVENRVENRIENRQEKFASSTRPMPKILDKRGNATSTKNASSTRALLPMRAVIGTITNLSGTSFTLTNGDQKTFTVDASSAKIFKRGNGATSTPPSTSSSTLTIADLTTGQTVVVLGDMASSSATIKAKEIIVGPLMPAGVRPLQIKDQSATVSNSLVGKIGDFFLSLFGR